MRKTTFISTLVICSLLINNKLASAQNHQGDLCVNAGVGSSTIFLLLDALQSNQTNASISYAITPAYNLMADQALGNVVSLGLAIGYQADIITTRDYANTQTGYYETVTENLSRLNVGMRVLFHFTHGDHFDAYSGLRIGLSHWNDDNNANDPNYALVKGNLNFPSFQLLYGMKFYFTDDVGLHLELALGTPYFIEGGLSFKLASGH